MDAGSSATLQVTLSESSGTPVTVYYQTADGTASREGTNYKYSDRLGRLFPPE